MHGHIGKGLSGGVNVVDRSGMELAPIDGASEGGASQDVRVVGRHMDLDILRRDLSSLVVGDVET